MSSLARGKLQGLLVHITHFDKPFRRNEVH